MIPSTSHFQFNSSFEGFIKSNFDKLFGYVDNMNNQLLDIRQHQASTINTLDVLTHDVAKLKEERRENPTTGNRGGKRGRGRRGR